MSPTDAAGAAGAQDGDLSAQYAQYYAMYGGYQNYMNMYYAYYGQQQQGGQPSRPSSQPATDGAASTANTPSTAPVPNRVSSLYSLSSGLGNSSSTSLTPSLNTLALTGGSSDDAPAHNADDSQNTPTPAATATPGTLKGPGLPGPEMAHIPTRHDAHRPIAQHRAFVQLPASRSQPDATQRLHRPRPHHGQVTA